MALIDRVGRSLIKRPARAVAGGIAGRSARGPIMAAAITAASAQGFAQGFNSSSGDLSSGVYELMSGDPEIDQYVFGTDVGIREMMLPLPQMPRVPGFDMIPNQIQDLAQNRRFLNSTMIGRHASAQRSGYYDRTMPQVNGSIVHALGQMKHG